MSFSLLVTFVLPHKTLEVVALEREKVDFRSQFWRFQFMIGALHCGQVAHDDGEKARGP